MLCGRVFWIWPGFAIFLATFIWEAAMSHPKPDLRIGTGNAGLVSAPNGARIESAGRASDGSLTSAACNRAPAGLTPGMFRRVQAHIDSHMDTAIHVGELASALHISVSHFIRSFRRSVGRTPHNYIMQCRLARATTLLTETDMALADIALRTGYSDQSHFTNSFSEAMGISPRAYRARHRGDD
jgi:transcriptional regulator GlxA family with amidase domain